MIDPRASRRMARVKRQAQAQDTSGWEAAIARTIGNCHSKQRAFADDPGNRIAALVGRRGGKTTGVRARFLRRLLTTPRANCLYLAATRESAEKLMWAPLKDLLVKLGFTLGVDAICNESKLRMTIPRNRAVLQLAGAGDKKEIEKIRGQAFHEVWIDECASMPAKLLEHLTERVIVPALADFEGTLGLIGTPGHHLEGPFYEVTRPGSEVSRRWDERDKFPGWSCWSLHTWTLQDGAAEIPVMQRVWEAALLEKANKGWSDDNPVWKREWLGLWAADDTENVFRYRPHTDEGEPWNQWDPERVYSGLPASTGFAKLPEGGDWSYVVALDEGYKDPFACNVFAYSPYSRDLLHVFGFERREMYARTIAELLLGPELDHENPTGLFKHTGWPDDLVADAGENLLAELRNVYGIAIDKADRRRDYKHDAIELTNGDLIDGHIKILKGSDLETQLLNLQWSVDDNGFLKENKAQANHSSDTLIYARRKTLHRFVETKPEPEPDPGTDAATDAWAAASLERLLGDDEGEFDSLLDDGSFDRFF